MAAVVARPGVVDTAPDVKPGFFGDQQNTSAAWAFRPAEIFGRKNPWRSSLARGLDDHRRSSSTLPPRTQLGLTWLGTVGHAARAVWRYRDAFVKLSWLWIIWRCGDWARGKTVQSVTCCDDPLRGLSRLAFERRAIGPAGQQAVFQLARAIKLVRQNPSDHEQTYDDAERDQRAALVVRLIVPICHERPIFTLHRKANARRACAHRRFRIHIRQVRKFGVISGVFPITESVGITASGRFESSGSDSAGGERDAREVDATAQVGESDRGSSHRQAYVPTSSIRQASGTRCRSR
jgi:hypothetical protein